MKNTILITGAGSGIGKATVQKFVKEKWNIIATDINESSIIDLKSDQVLTFRLDVTNLNDFKKIYAKGEAKFKKIDAILNSAGIMSLNAIAKQPEEEIDNMLNINLKGLINGSQVASQAMIKNKEGTIVNIASIAGIKGFPNHAIYCGTKYGVRGFSETLREELIPHNIRVSIVSPGVVDTNLLSSVSNKEILNSYNEWKYTNNRFIQPQDVANAIYFIVSQPKNVTIREIVIGSSTQEA